jgi:hypothetical protein
MPGSGKRRENAVGSPPGRTDQRVIATARTPPHSACPRTSVNRPRRQKVSTASRIRTDTARGAATGLVEGNALARRFGGKRRARASSTVAQPEQLRARRAGELALRIGLAPQVDESPVRRVLRSAARSSWKCSLTSSRRSCQCGPISAGRGAAVGRLTAPPAGGPGTTAFPRPRHAASDRRALAGQPTAIFLQKTRSTFRRTIESSHTWCRFTA